MMRDQNLTSFIELVNAAGMSAVFSDPGTVLTVFVPTNSAIESFLEDPEVNFEDLLSFEAASLLVFYHITPKITYSSMFIDGRILSSLLDKSNSPCGINELVCGTHTTPKDESNNEAMSVHISIYGGSATAQIKESDVMACKSVIHVIDTVLLPCSYGSLIGSGGVPG